MRPHCDPLLPPQASLKEMGLPTEALHNAAQGGADRRGFDDAAGECQQQLRPWLLSCARRPGLRPAGWRGIGVELRRDSVLFAAHV